MFWLFTKVFFARSRRRAESYKLKLFSGKCDIYRQKLKQRRHTNRRAHGRATSWLFAREDAPAGGCWLVDERTRDQRDTKRVRASPRQRVRRSRARWTRRASARLDACFSVC